MKLFLASNLADSASHIACGMHERNLLFITTAAEAELNSDLSWLDKDKEALIHAGFHITTYTITGKTTNQIADEFSSHEIICFSGGNTFYLLQQIQITKIKDLINNTIQKKVYMGSSAGSVIAGPDLHPILGLDDIAKAPLLTSQEGLGLVDFVILPHWGSKDFAPYYFPNGIKEAYTEKYKLILLNNNQYVASIDGNYKIIDITKDEPLER